jgi:hypothetical protein
MTSAGKEKNFIEEAVDYVRSNSTIFLGVGLTLTGLALSLGYLSKRQHPDFRKVIQLRTVIEKSYPRALQSLESLKIEKRILTEYGIEGERQGHSSELNMLYLLITRLKLKEANKEKELRNPFLPPFEEVIVLVNSGAVRIGAGTDSQATLQQVQHFQQALAGRDEGILGPKQRTH